MNSFIGKANNVLKNDGFSVFIKRLFNYTMVKLRRLFRKSEFGDWDSLKDKYKGKRIFILGNGPSLNQTELHLLKDEYTMCFNRVNLMLERLNWKPNFYVMTDDLLIKDMSEEVKNEIIPVVDYAFFPDIHPSNVNFRKRIGKHKNVFFINTDIPEFRSDLPHCGINKTVVNAGMQIAAFLGFSEIYLLGVDMTFGDHKVKKSNSREWKSEKDDDPNHFDPRYFGKGRSYHNPTVHEMLEEFEKGAIFFDKLSVKVYNAGIGGKLEAFPRTDFYQLFDLPDEEKSTLFLEKINEYQKFDSIDEVFNSLTTINSNDELPISSFQTDASIASSTIKNTIFTHIPFGPFENKFVYLKRN